MTGERLPTTPWAYRFCPPHIVAVITDVSPQGKAVVRYQKENGTAVTEQYTKEVGVEENIFE